MKEIIIDSFAKINLGLQVIDRREDGYHNIETIFQELTLRDGIYMREQGDHFDFSCDHKGLPIGEGNLIHAAWREMKKHYNGNPGLRIHLEKNIPIAAGLAGGSSNAAATIRGLDELWDLKMSREEMVQIGAKLGADVPFFFYGHTAYGKGRGDEIVPLPPFSDKMVLIVNTGYGISTKFVYEHLDLAKPCPIDFEAVMRGIREGEDEVVYRNLANKLEQVSLSIHPEIAEIKQDMLKMGAKVSMMCGSGPSVFGIFDNERKLENAFFYFKDKFELVFSSRTR